jgi:hypothetical protein
LLFFSKQSHAAVPFVVPRRAKGCCRGRFASALVLAPVVSRGGKSNSQALPAMTQDSKTPMPPAASGPTASGRRYLAQVMEHAFREGWRTPDDFVKHFPADVIMAALKPAPDLRVAILAAATGIYEEILRRKTPALAAEDLRLALDEGTTSSMQLLSVFSPEDRVRFLDPHRLWDFLAEDRFWELDRDASDELRQSAVERMTFTLNQALQERLITLRDILEGLTYEAVADSLSPQELRSVVRHALVKGRDGIGLSEKVLLEVLPLDKLVRSVPLEHIWREVVIRRLAVPCGLTDLTREAERGSQAAPRSVAPKSVAPKSVAPKSVVPQSVASRNAAPSQPWSSRPSGPPALPADLVRGLPSDQGGSTMPPSREMSAAGVYPESFASVEDYAVREYSEDDDAMTAVPPSVVAPQSQNSPGKGRSPLSRSSLPPPLAPGSGPLTDDFNEPLPNQPALTQPSLSRPQPAAAGFDTGAEATDRQRQRVTEHLRAIGRLPPRHTTMPAALLRAIDVMYALLPSATDDIQRKSVIRQAFGNENYLRAALLGLIELMDSSVDTSDPVIQEAKIEALIKILLFEEQRRKETGRFPTGSFNGQRSAPSSFPPGSYPPGSFGGAGAGEAFNYPQQYPTAYARQNRQEQSRPDAYAEGPYRQGAAEPYSQEPYSQQPYRQDPYLSEQYASQQSGQSSSQGYASGVPGSSPLPHVATQRPPPPVLSGGPGYPGSSPLPNLPAEPASSRRRTVPPPLPPSYPRG